MVGYLAKYINEICAVFICHLCQLILREPVQLDCGHRFCRVCVEHAGEKIINCQICKESTMQLQVWRDRGFERDMKDLSVHCYGCDWKGRFEQYPTHLTNIFGQPHAYNVQDRQRSSNSTAVSIARHPLDEDVGQAVTNNMLAQDLPTQQPTPSANLHTVQFNSQLEVSNDPSATANVTSDTAGRIEDGCCYMWEIREGSLLAEQTNRNTMTQLRLTTHDRHVLYCKLYVRKNRVQLVISPVRGEYDSLLKWPFERQIAIGFYNVALQRTDHITPGLLNLQLPKTGNATSDENLPTQVLHSIPVSLILANRKSYVVDDLIRLRILLCQKPLPNEALEEAMQIDHFIPTHSQQELFHRVREKHEKVRQVR